MTSFVLTDQIRTEDNEKLREKVDEALAVYHDYAKTQGQETTTTSGAGSATTAVDSGTTNGESDSVHA